MKLNKNIWKVLSIIVLVFALSSCGQTQVQNEKNTNNQQAEEQRSTIYPYTLVDSYDREITIEEEPMRIISVAPSITETMFALGAEDKLIGRTTYCDFPEEASAIETIGSLREPSIEKIVELNPDLVIGATHFNKEVLEKLESLDIKVVILYGSESFEGVYGIIDKASIVVNKQDEGKMLIDNMKETVEDVISRVKDVPKPSVYYVVAFGQYGDYTAGKDTFISQLIEMAGGENAANDVEGWKYSLERLVEKDPDILICSKYYDSKVGIENSHGYDELTAVKEGKLFEIDNNPIDRQGPRLAQGLKSLAKIIHPEAFE